jgi:GTP-binding protein YchF
MPLTAGIVGLPNVGKSTLFNAITRSSVEAANYPFATINPNVGVVEVKDPRVDDLVKIFKPKKTIYTTFEFTDIAGLVKGASQGEGLGNQFLSHIRNVDAIVHVVRCFDDPDITHVHDKVDPLSDIDVINLELILADQQSIEKSLSKVERRAKAKEKEGIFEFALLTKVNQHLLEGKSVRSLALDDNEQLVLKSFHLLTAKPVIYVANMAEDTVTHPGDNRHYQAVKQFAEAENADVIAICAKIEEELASLSDEERDLFLQDLGYSESGLDQIVKATYHLLGLQTFLTGGPDEVRAWTFTKGMKAPECAGVIHTDFQKGFIKAEAYSYTDLMTYGSESAVKDAGKLRIEGKEYTVQDGDILHFRFNV